MPRPRFEKTFEDQRNIFLVYEKSLGGEFFQTVFLPLAVISPLTRLMATFDQQTSFKMRCVCRTPHFDKKCSKARWSSKEFFANAICYVGERFRVLQAVPFHGPFGVSTKVPSQHRTYTFWQFFMSISFHSGTHSAGEVVIEGQLTERLASARLCFDRGEGSKLF